MKTVYFKMYGLIVGIGATVFTLVLLGLLIPYRRYLIGEDNKYVLFFEIALFLSGLICLLYFLPSYLKLN